MSGTCLPTPRGICAAVELSGVRGALDYTSGPDSLDLNFLGNDQTNPRSFRGPSDFDWKHRFVASFTCRPPAWRSAPRVVRQILFHDFAAATDRPFGVISSTVGNPGLSNSC